MATEIAVKWSNALLKAGATEAGKQKEPTAQVKAMMIGYLADSIDLTYSALKLGKDASPRAIWIWIVNKGLSIVNFLPESDLKCVGSLAGLMANIAASIPVEAAELAAAPETGGASLALSYATAAQLVAAAYGTNEDCKVQREKLTKSVTDKLDAFAAQMDYEFSAWINSQMAPMQFMDR